MSEDSTDPMAEVKAMQRLAEAVAPLDLEATARVLRWAVARYGVAVDTGTGSRGRSGGPSLMGSASENGTANGTTVPQFNDLAELYAAATPDSDADKALVGGYWFQFVQGQADFAAQAINSALKDLGHGLSNITSAFDTLKAQKPALVMQLKKAGTTKQARKRYKLTAAGKNAVELLIGQH